MTIRKAEEKDILRIIELLGQVLQIHADIKMRLLEEMVQENIHQPYVDMILNMMD